MNADTWILLAIVAMCVACLIVGILIGVGLGRDDEAARHHENQDRRDRLFPTAPRVLR